MTVRTTDGGMVRRHVPPRWRRISEAAGDTASGYGAWLRAEAESAWQGLRAPAVERRHALVVATSLPPRFDGGVFRPLSWLRYAGENCWRISAVTRAPDGDETEAGRQLAALIPRDVTVCHAPPPSLRPSRRLFAQVDGGLLTALALYRSGVETFAASPPAAVIATGPSFAAFVAGQLLARHFRSRLVLDYRDEWSENPFGFVHQGRDDRWWEQRCLAVADAVLFTTRAQLRHAEAVFRGLVRGKGTVLLNGWEPDPSVAAAEHEPRDGGRLVIATSGVLGTMALPGPFLRDLSHVLESAPALKAGLRLRFIGRRLEPAERELGRFPHPELLELIDQCPRAEADRLIRRSDVLLLLTDLDMARYLPGKLFEYLATGRPILVHGQRGEAQALVQQLGAGLYTEEGSVDALAKALHALSQTGAETWNTDRRRTWARDHTRRRLARAFFARLSELTAADGARGARR